MLESIGIEKIEDLFKAIPEEVLLERELKIPEGLSELEFLQKMKKLAAKNISLDELNSFLGAGAYDHYIPTIINHLVSRSEYYTAYTPYQAELSQGSLQAIYEYQSMICALTGMEVANASLLDGGSAVGEAVNMAGRISRKKKIILSEAVHPFYRQIAETYGKEQGLEFMNIPLTGSISDISILDKEIDSQTAAVVIQYPNFLGSIEEMKEIQQMLSREKRALLIVIANPIALALLTPPGQLGADIVVGEGQSLGNTINYGGPYLGFMACKKKYLRQMPGRVVGATTDVNGEKGFVMTLQTREQHIRREKATSNICTNEALNALIATIYLSIMGKKGLQEVAEQCLKKAHYLGEKLNDLAGYKILNQNYFNEFFLETPIESSIITNDLKKKGILPGLDLSLLGYDFNGLLICVTEKKSRDELDELLRALEVYSNV